MEDISFKSFLKESKDIYDIVKDILEKDEYDEQLYKKALFYRNSSDKGFKYPNLNSIKINDEYYGVDLKNNKIEKYRIYDIQTALGAGSKSAVRTGRTGLIKIQNVKSGDVLPKWYHIGFLYVSKDEAEKALILRVYLKKYSDNYD